MPVDPPALLLLLLAALTAGWVDAVVGGGGLIQLPSLLLGLPTQPVPTVSGTNKVSSFGGTLTATATYLRAVRLRAHVALPLMGTALLGSACGARLSRHIPRETFTPVLFLVMVGVGWYTYRRPALGLVSAPRLSARRRLLAVAGIGGGVGFYDGLLGPGTGTFFILLLVTVLGLGFLEASAYAKLGNAATNLAAISVFAWHGQVLWGLGLAMCAANVTGGLLGARTALRRGNGFVRVVFLVVVSALALKLGANSVFMAIRALRLA